MRDREAEPRGASAHSPAQEPLGWWEARVRATAAGADAAAAAILRFELSSRGDRVPGQLRIPAGSGPFPLVLLAHDGTGPGGPLDADPLGAACLAAGAAVAQVELPLHGERSSAKLSERLLQALAAGPDGRAPADARDRNGPMLLAEFDRQCACDLARALDALLARDEVDAERVAFVGVGAGARAGAGLRRGDVRAGAWVLAGDAAGTESGAATGTRLLAGKSDLSRAAVGHFLAETLGIDPAPFAG